MSPRTDRPPAPQPSTEELKARDARRARQADSREARRKEAARSKSAYETLRNKQKKGRGARRKGQAIPSRQEQYPQPVARSGAVAWREANLTPAQALQFDPADGLARAVVWAEVPFTMTNPEHPDATHKERPCVVVAGSKTHLLVRPGYSEGGFQARTWTSRPLRDWHSAGLAKSTWIEATSTKIPREKAGRRVGWLSPHDWNHLW